MAFDFFVGLLKCPNCAFVSKADSSTNIQIKIRKQPSFECFGIGDILEATLEDLKGGGYETLRLPDEGKDIILIDMWDCPNCGQARNWVKIVIRNGKIVDISAVENKKEILSKAHFLVDECAHDIGYWPK
ncbi:hypothetical protein [Synechococcus sp. PCC 7336]|uniref:hypothetical protein n=1 Tax=Synechococcus sp. PCC 7336 TaxID=195250 RepID=UPI0003684AB7|nr:hypothetical protein [Synechococcus sp. PCC 7336]